MTTEREVELLREIADLKRRTIERYELVRWLLSEVDCRVEHGAESGGHLEFVRGRLEDLVHRW